MSEKFTFISLPGTSSGLLAERGIVAKEEMIVRVRSYADLLRKELADLDAAKDEEFNIVSATGLHVMRDRKIIQNSTRVTNKPTDLNKE